MGNAAGGDTPDPISANMYIGGNPSFPGDLIDTSGLPEDDIEHIARVMNSLARLREAERLLADASRTFMKLSALDMRALHYLIAARRQSAIVTPGLLATHLRISAASVTKLINRLERGEHVVRRMHPTDRRAFAIEITAKTEQAAKETVGRAQSRRFYAAARLTGEERAAVIRFLDDMAAELSLSHADWAHDHEDGTQKRIVPQSERNGPATGRKESARGESE